MYFMFFAPVNIVSAFHNDIVVVTRKRELSFYVCLIIHCTRSKCLQPHPLHAHLCQIQERSLKLAILWIWKVWALVSNSHAQGIHSCIYILLHLSLQKKESCLQLLFNASWWKVFSVHSTNYRLSEKLLESALIALIAEAKMLSILLYKLFIYLLIRTKMLICFSLGFSEYPLVSKWNCKSSVL